MAACPRCGKPVSDDALFCAACGASMPAAGTPPPTPPPPVGSAPLPPPGSDPGTAFAPPPAPPAGTAPPSPPTSYAAAPPGIIPQTPPPPAARGTGRVVKIVLVSAVIGILVIGGGLTATIYFVYRAVKPPVDATNRFIAAVNEGNTQEAWDLLHPSSYYKRNYDSFRFRQEVVEQLSGTLSSWNANQSSVSGSEAEVGVDMTDADGSEYRVTFSLRKDGDDWLILDWVEGAADEDG